MRNQGWQVRRPATTRSGIEEKAGNDKVAVRYIAPVICNITVSTADKESKPPHMSQG